MIVVYDIETIAGCFTYSAIDINSNETYQYVLHKNRFELKELIEHLNQCRGQIGFNNINFDYPIIHYILKTFSNYKDSDPYWFTHEDVIKDIYNEAQRIIDLQNNPIQGQFASIRESEVFIPQLDLFRIHHFNNRARSQSLKGLEIAINYPNVMDMPINHSEEYISLDQIDEILEYNLNDVLATYEFYELSLDKIRLRKDLKKIYNLPMTNWDDVKIGENIFLKLLSEDMGINKWDLKKLRTYRSSIDFKDIILPYINYQNSALNQLLESFKTTTISSTKNGFNKSIKLKNEVFEYGQGGIHQSTKPGIYIKDSDYQILDIDVSSFYPNIAVNNNFRPEHLGESFTKIYKSIYLERAKIPKSDPRNGAYKLMLNGSFGKAGDENSFLYDNKFLLSITVNGQLLISMLIDRLINIDNLHVLQSNTDGITIRFQNKDLELIQSICRDWESITNLKLEYKEYSKMIIRDVNNYCAIDIKNNIKYKGAFEIDKEYHKDNSFRIIPIALSNYFFNNIPVEETIKNHRNIYDFCGRQKFKRGDWGEIARLYGNIKQQKNVRYYISNKGFVFVKYYKKGSTEVINKGYQVIIFNKFEDKNWEDYNINYQFYISECYKEIDNIEPKQLTLF